MNTSSCMLAICLRDGQNGRTVHGAFQFPTMFPTTAEAWVKIKRTSAICILPSNWKKSIQFPCWLIVVLEHRTITKSPLPSFATILEGRNATQHKHSAHLSKKEHGCFPWRISSIFGIHFSICAHILIVVYISLDQFNLDGMKTNEHIVAKHDIANAVTKHFQIQ